MIFSISADLQQFRFLPLRPIPTRTLPLQGREFFPVEDQRPSKSRFDCDEAKKRSPVRRLRFQATSKRFRDYRMKSISL
jgi:hypothetical protein